MKTGECKMCGKIGDLDENDICADCNNKDVEILDSEEILPKTNEVNNQNVTKIYVSKDMVYCRECGREMSAKAKTCPHCGCPSYIYSSNDDDGKKSVNKIAYVLLTFFLGGIGAHKFYAGKTGIGVLYLLFCWTFIPACIAFVEFIIALCKKSDINGNILV